MTISLKSASKSVDEVLLALADECRRLVVQYFQGTTEHTASCDELAAYVRENGSSDLRCDDVEIRLHHADLPKLADAGLIEYDAPSNTVRYQPHRSVETVVDAIGTLEGS